MCEDRSIEAIRGAAARRDDPTLCLAVKVIEELRTKNDKLQIELNECHENPVKTLANLFEGEVFFRILLPEILEGVTEATYKGIFLSVDGETKEVGIDLQEKVTHTYL